MTAAQTPEEIIRAAIDVAVANDPALLSALDEVDAPLYVTDEDGYVTYFNPACIAFAGRTPTLRQDRWCVTWKLYTDANELLPHDNCPMARAIKEERAVRGLCAVAERPDGTRVAFMPYPTPIFSEGRLIGAVNILVDITDPAQVLQLLEQATRSRRLARAVNDDETANTLERLAAEYEDKARLLRACQAAAATVH